MPRPIDGSGDPTYPRWGSVETTETVPINGVISTVSTRTEPPQPFKEQGLKYHINLPYDYVNYQFNLLDQWVEYIDDTLEEQFTQPQADGLYLRQDQNLADLDSAPAARTFLDVLSVSETNTLVSTAIDNLLDGAPGALDTLNELAASLGDDANFATTVTNSINTRVSQDVLVGAIFPIGMGTPSTGTLACEGQAISRTTYARLFSAIGTSWGVGDGSTTFNIPDLRGEFIRGFDSGRGVDVGRALFSQQADDFEAHRHFTVDGSDVVVNPGFGGAVDATRTVVRIGETGGDSNYSLAGRVIEADSGLSSEEGGIETRPRNIALRYAIVY